MATLTMKELLEAGVHFGHQTKRWNPKMQKYIFGERNGIYTSTCRDPKKFGRGVCVVRDLAAGGGTVLFVARRRTGGERCSKSAPRGGMFYVEFTGWLRTGP